MPDKDLDRIIEARVALETQLINTNTITVGRIIDTSGFQSLVFVLQSGEIVDGSYNPLVEQGDDAGLSDATLLPADEQLGVPQAFSLLNDHQVFRIGSIGKKRYQRLSIISTGINGGDGGVLSAVAILGHPHSTPTISFTTQQ